MLRYIAKVQRKGYKLFRNELLGCTSRHFPATRKFVGPWIFLWHNWTVKTRVSMGNPSKMNQEFSRKLVPISLGRFFFWKLGFQEKSFKGETPPLTSVFQWENFPISIGRTRFFHVLRLRSRNIVRRFGLSFGAFHGHPGNRKHVETNGTWLVLLNFSSWQVTVDGQNPAPPGKVKSL